MNIEKSPNSSTGSASELERFCAALLQEQAQLRQTCVELRETCAVLSTTCGSLEQQIFRQQIENRKLKDELQTAYSRALATVDTRLAQIEKMEQVLRNSSAQLSTSLMKLSTTMSRR